MRSPTFWNKLSCLILRLAYWFERFQVIQLLNYQVRILTWHMLCVGIYLAHCVEPILLFTVWRCCGWHPLLWRHC
jgi:hypothetical protein